MTYVVVYTDAGEQVWSHGGVKVSHVLGLDCPGNSSGSSLAAGLRRAVQDAEKIEAGRDPERPSERAMRLAGEGES